MTSDAVLRLTCNDYVRIVVELRRVRNIHGDQPVYIDIRNHARSAVQTFDEQSEVLQLVSLVRVNEVLQL